MSCRLASRVTDCGAFKIRLAAPGQGCRPGLARRLAFDAPTPDERSDAVGAAMAMLLDANMDEVPSILGDTLVAGGAPLPVKLWWTFSLALALAERAPVES